MEEMTKVKVEIEFLEAQLLSKRNLLAELELKLGYSNVRDVQKAKYSGNFDCDEITRYSRQMLMPNIGVSGQLKLRASRVLIVGAGGLGCPSALYLAAAGVGHITIVDNDEAELSNLHRQILHYKRDIGCSKVISACDKLTQLNDRINVLPVHTHVNSKSVCEILDRIKYDVVIDATDNVATRYLLNDACVLSKVPLVSGSALQMEGQLTVYNYNGGPCYRCLYPTPPPPEAVTSCGDGGVLGAVPGVIGVLQALEAIKVILGESNGVLSGRILTFDGTDTTFRQIKVNMSRINCAICGSNPSITTLIDYEQFCQARAHDKVVNINILKEDEKVQPRDLFATFELMKQPLIDVRPALEFEMCHLPQAVNLPFSEISSASGNELKNVFIEKQLLCDKVYVVCRRGNDSQRAIRKFKDKFPQIKFVNVTGGLHAYSEQVDEAFPVY